MRLGGEWDLYSRRGTVRSCASVGPARGEAGAGCPGGWGSLCSDRHCLQHLALEPWAVRRPLQIHLSKMDFLHQPDEASFWATVPYRDPEDSRTPGPLSEAPGLLNGKWSPQGNRIKRQPGAVCPPGPRAALSAWLALGHGGPGLFLGS